MKELKKGERIYGIKPLPETLVTYVPEIGAVCDATKLRIRTLLVDFLRDNRSAFIAGDSAYATKNSNALTQLVVYSWAIPDRIFPKLFSWDLVTNRGGLGKRIKAHLYKQFGIKLPHDLSEKIGMVIADNVIATKEYSIDVTSNFNWNAGDFGDSASCFFSERVGIRIDMMSTGKFKALRFFTKDLLGKRQGVGRYHSGMAGIGRSWVWKTVIREEHRHAVIGNEAYVLFNGYGPSTHWQAKFLSNYLDLPMKMIALTNQRRSAGALYVNDDYGFVFGKTEVIKNIKQLDLQTKESFVFKAGFEDD
jgi:hypothetical protein